MNRLSRKNLLLIPARKINNDNYGNDIYSVERYINSCRDCSRKSYCPYADLMPRNMPLCIRFNAGKYTDAINEDQFYLYVPVGMDMIYVRLLIGGEKCTN